MYRKCNVEKLQFNVIKSIENGNQSEHRTLNTEHTHMLTVIFQLRISCLILCVCILCASLFAVCNVKCFVGNNFRFECGSLAGDICLPSLTMLIRMLSDSQSDDWLLHCVSFSTNSRELWNFHHPSATHPFLLVWTLNMSMQTIDKQTESRVSMQHHLMFLFIFVLRLPIFPRVLHWMLMLSFSLTVSFLFAFTLVLAFCCFVIHTPLYLPVSVHFEPATTNK